MPQVVMLMHEERSAFGASFPDFPGCTTVASTLDSLIAKAPEVLAFHASGMMEDGLDLPHLRTLAEWRADPAFLEDARGATIILLDVDLPGRTVRVNVTLDEGMLKRIDRAARSSGETRSGFLVAAARDRLAKAL